MKRLDFDSSVDENFDHNISSGCDVGEHDTSSEDLSNIIVGRKLDFSDGVQSSFSVNEFDMSVDSDYNNSGLTNVSHSPPYKRVRALRLMDSPATPKTIFEKCSIQTPVYLNKSFLFVDKRPRSRLFPSKLCKTFGPGSTGKPAANTNPFTPTGMLLASKKRTRSKRSLIGYIIWLD